jgi:hypothetical protein
MIDASGFLGLSKKNSQNKAESMNLIFRLVSIDGAPFLGYPEDTRNDRVCVEIVEGVVIKAVIQ